MILGTCKTAKDCTWVQCTKDGQAVPVPAPPPAATQSTCDMTHMFKWFGMHPYTGQIQLMTYNPNTGNIHKYISFPFFYIRIIYQNPNFLKYRKRICCTSSLR